MTAKPEKIRRRTKTLKTDLKTLFEKSAKYWNDLRGPAATKFYIAGLSIRVIAEILAWSEDQVERIIRRHASRAAATKEAIRQLNAARKAK